jgi:hypothetical protein
MVNLMSKNLTKLILMVNLMRQKFNPLTISVLNLINFDLINLINLFILFLVVVFYL